VEDAESAMALRLPPWKSGSTGIVAMSKTPERGTRFERPDILPQSFAADDGRHCHNRAALCGAAKRPI